MARPRKTGIDYWPLDVDAQHDDKFVSVAAFCGEERAWYVWTRLLQELYRVGCCYRWDTDVCAVFSHKIGLKPPEAATVVNQCLKSGLFDSEVYHDTGFLTSRGIQKRYFYTVRGRAEVTIPEGVLLLDAKKLGETILINIKEKNRIEHISRVSDVILPVSNVETPKPPEPKKKKPAKPAKDPDKQALKTYPNLQFSEAEVAKLITKYAQLDLDLDSGFEILQAYSINNTKPFKKYKSHYLVMLGWVITECQKRKRAEIDLARSESYLDRAKN